MDLFKLWSIESMIPSKNLLLCCPLLLLLLIFPSIRVFSNELALCNRWPKYWSFRFSISPSSEYSGLISFRIDRFDLLVVKWTLKNLLQHHSSKASILCHSVQTDQLKLSYILLTENINYASIITENASFLFYSKYHCGPSPIYFWLPYCNS